MSSLKPTSFKRSGLHRLECQDCPGYAYLTVACLETVGMPSCACGGRLVPERLELALLLGVDDAPVVREWQRLTDRKERAQMPHARRPCQMSEHLASMAERAASEITAQQRHESRERRLRALAPTPEALPF